MLQRLYEEPLRFENARRNLDQVFKGGIPGAEIVQRQRESFLSKPAQAFQVFFREFHFRAFGNLQGEFVPGIAEAGENGQKAVRELVGHRLQRRKIHVQEEVPPMQPPFHALRQRRFANPFVKLADHAKSLDFRYEQAGRHRCAPGGKPAAQGLAPDPAIARRVDDGLIAHRKAAHPLPDGIDEIVPQAHHVPQPRVHALVVQRIARLFPAGRVSGAVQEVSHVAANVLSVDDAHLHRAIHSYRAAVIREFPRPRKPPQYLFSAHSHVLKRYIPDEQAEFIVVHPVEPTGFPQGGKQPVANPQQKFVADLPAVQVIDAREPADIEVDKRRPVEAGDRSHILFQLLPVRELKQAIVIRHLFVFILGVPDVGDVGDAQENGGTSPHPFDPLGGDLLPYPSVLPKVNLRVHLVVRAFGHQLRVKLGEPSLEDFAATPAADLLRAHLHVPAHMPVEEQHFPHVDGNDHDGHREFLVQLDETPAFDVVHFADLLLAIFSPFSKANAVSRFTMMSWLARAPKKRRFFFDGGIGSCPRRLRCNAKTKQKRRFPLAIIQEEAEKRIDKIRGSHGEIHKSACATGRSGSSLLNSIFGN